MAKKFISFLGTNKYVPCTYYYDDKDVSNVGYVQEALVYLQCERWTAEDEIIIFVTPEAKSKNWVDDGHGSEKNEGLHQRLLNLKLSCQIQSVLIPNGKSEKEIWEIFNLVCDQLDEKDEVILDITHALRSLPLLAMVVLQYMRVLKDIILNGIFYGAFDVLGLAQDVIKMPLEKRRVPIFDLTAFARLTDWSVAVDRFLAAGDATRINDLVKMEALPIIKEGRSHNRREEALVVKNLAKRLQDFTNAMTTCRGRSISKCAKNLHEAIGRCGQTDLVTPLVPLIEKIRERTKGFSGTDEIRDGVRAAKWCLEHNLIQQAYTILQETGISYFLIKADGVASGTHPLDVKKRNLVTGAVVLQAKKEDSSKGRYPEGYEELWQRIWTTIHDEGGCRTMSLIEQRRNDLNHAGINEGSVRAEKFTESIWDAVDWFEKALNKEWFHDGGKV